MSVTMLTWHPLPVALCTPTHPCNFGLGACWSTLAKMTRQERKALDREIPWRQIMKMDQTTIDAYVEANIKEYQSWMSWGSIKPLEKQQVVNIKNDPSLRRRIIPARNAYRDKNRGADVLKAKCRTVVLGCCDPDIGHLDRESHLLPQGCQKQWSCNWQPRGWKAKWS